MRALFEVGRWTGYGEGASPGDGEWMDLVAFLRMAHGSELEHKEVERGWLKVLQLVEPSPSKAL